MEHLENKDIIKIEIPANNRYLSILSVCVDIYDNGTLFNLKEVNLPSLDKPQVRGYGLFIVQNLMDKVIYEETHDRNHWRLVKVFS